MVQGTLASAYMQFLAGAGVPPQTPMSVSATKTDGQQIVVDGAPAYRVFVRFVAVFPNGLRPECIPNKCQPIQGLSYSRTRKTVVYDGSGDLTRSEAGWRVVGGTFNWNQPISDMNEVRLLTDAEKEDPNCQRKVGTQAQIDEASRAGGVPQKNKLSLLPGDKLQWNGNTIDLDTAKQYIDMTKSLTPMPFLIYDRQPGSTAQFDTRVREVLRNNSMCFM